MGRPTRHRPNAWRVWVLHQAACQGLGTGITDQRLQMQNATKRRETHMATVCTCMLKRARQRLSRSVSSCGEATGGTGTGYYWVLPWHGGWATTRRRRIRRRTKTTTTTTTTPPTIRVRHAIRGKRKLTMSSTFSRLGCFFLFSSFPLPERELRRSDGRLFSLLAADGGAVLASDSLSLPLDLSHLSYQTTYYFVLPTSRMVPLMFRCPYEVHTYLSVALVAPCVPVSPCPLVPVSLCPPVSTCSPIHVTLTLVVRRVKPVLSFVVTFSNALVPSFLQVETDAEADTSISVVPLYAPPQDPRCGWRRPDSWDLQHCITPALEPRIASWFGVFLALCFPACYLLFTFAAW